MKMTPVRMPDALVKRARKAAEKDGRTLAGWIRWTIEKALAAGEKGERS